MTTRTRTKWPKSWYLEIYKWNIMTPNLNQNILAKLTRQQTDLFYTYLDSCYETLVYFPRAQMIEDEQPRLNTINWTPAENQPITTTLWATWDGSMVDAGALRHRVRRWNHNIYFAVKRFRIQYNNGEPIPLGDALKLILCDPRMMAAIEPYNTERLRCVFDAASRILYRFLRAATFILKKRRCLEYRVTLHKVIWRTGFASIGLDFPDDVLHNVMRMLV